MIIIITTRWKHASYRCRLSYRYYMEGRTAAAVLYIHPSIESLRPSFLILIYLPWNDHDDDVEVVVHIGQLSLEPQRLSLETPTSSCGSPSDTSSPYLCAAAA
jgi:hypothetical protein